MSMNLADSSDLIHEGRGGVRVFWLSRSAFERRLLVLVAALSVLLLVFIITTAVLGAQVSSYGTTKSDASPTPIVYGHLDHHGPQDHHGPLNQYGPQDHQPPGPVLW